MLIATKNKLLFTKIKFCSTKLYLSRPLLLRHYYHFITLLLLFTVPVWTLHPQPPIQSLNNLSYDEMIHLIEVCASNDWEGPSHFVDLIRLKNFIAFFAKDKIANPSKYCPDWDKMDPRHKQSLVEVKWPAEIQCYTEQRDILQSMLDLKQ